MKKNSLLLLSVGLASFSTNTWSNDTIFKCRNQQGNIIYQKSACSENVKTVSSWTSVIKEKPPEKDPEKKAHRELVVKQGANGHYFLEGSVNNKSLMFVIDTGASVVSLPASLASDAGMACKEKVIVDTANGQTDACTVVISELKFGHFVVKNAPARVVPNLSQPLLGMNVLQQFNMKQENGEMRISARD
ncbi:TIGR02281 family clan AA aspartic protease [Methylobacter sp. Wu1]|jgi:clan AA aspartic protease (TIGR02281 family)|uniref:retropepsin-like aspartic protease family protein n=1 Tax=Methylobacter sp. Wu1 TaxID=3119359 RepID=UPI002F93009A